jgi:hypothetical protein
MWAARDPRRSRSDVGANNLRDVAVGDVERSALDPRAEACAVRTMTSPRTAVLTGNSGTG